MLYTKIQPLIFLGSGQEDFKEFLPYMDMMAILFNCATEGPCEIWWNMLKRFQRRRHLNITHFYTCIYPNGKGR